MQPEEKYFKFAKYFFSSICAEYLTHHSTEDKHDARENPNGQSGDALRITELFLIHTQQFHVKQLQYGLASQNMSRVYKLSPNDTLKLVNNRQMIIYFLFILFMPRYFLQINISQLHQNNCCPTILAKNRNTTQRFQRVSCINTFQHISQNEVLSGFKQFFLIFVVLQNRSSPPQFSHSLLSSCSQIVYLNLKF